MTDEAVQSENLIGTEEAEVQDDSWRGQHLPEDLRDNDTLKKFEDVGALGGAYLKLQEMLGSRAKIPSEESTDEERGEFYNKLGRPEAPDKYDIQIDEKYSQTIEDQQKIKDFKEKAFQQGLTNTQAQGAIDFYSSMIEGAMVDVETSKAQARVDAESVLKKEWGTGQYRNNLALSRRAFNKFADTDLKEFVEKSGVSNNVAFIRFLHKIGIGFSDPEMAGMGKDTSGVDADSAKIEVDALMKDKQHKYHEALFDAKHVKHAEAIAYRDRLYDSMYGDEEE